MFIFTISDIISAFVLIVVIMLYVIMYFSAKKKNERK